MRGLISLLVVVYLVGVGVELAPVVQAQWNSGTAAEFASSVAQALPDAMAWPAKVIRNLTNRG
ncbi:hypothetical protein LMIY3S_04151 [Labrys miyagiensis]